MLVNDITTGIVAEQNHHELAQRAAEERLAHEVIRAQRARDDRPERRWSRFVRSLTHPTTVGPARHRTAH